MEHSHITNKIIGSAMKIHTDLGPGLLESCYRECLYFKLKESGLIVEREKPIPLVYENIKLDTGFRVDLYVENAIVCELKSIEAIHEVHLAQLLTYMRLSNSKVGLLINFNVMHLKDGIRRRVL